MARFRKFALFLIAGGLNTGFGFLSYAALVLVGMPLWLTVVLSMLAALFFNYLTYGGVVFKNLSRRNMPKFVVFYSLVAVLNYLGLRMLTSVGVGPIISQAFLLPALAVFSFIGMSKYVFAQTKNLATRDTYGT